MAVVTARANSKGLPGKNYKALGGRPLVQWSIMAADHCEQIDHIIISSNCRYVREVTEDYISEFGDDKILFVDRPEELSGPVSKNEEALLHATQVFEDEYRYLDQNDIIVNLQPTSPLRYGGLLGKCIKEMHEAECDSLLTVNKETPFYWKILDGKPVASYDFKNRPMRQELSDSDWIFHDNGNVYAMTVDTLVSGMCRIGDNPFLYETDRFQSLQIDTNEDFTLIEKIAEDIDGIV